jgi:PfaD family protein
VDTGERGGSYPLTWVPAGDPPAFGGPGLLAAVRRIREPLYLIDGGPAGTGVAVGGRVGGPDGFPVAGTLPPLYPEWLGDRTFAETHQTRFSYAAGEMAGGIATTTLVTEMARAGMLAFFGSAGLPLSRVEAAIGELTSRLPGQASWGVNLIHSPAKPAFEDALADLLLRTGVPAVSASAFMELTPAVVRLACSGLGLDDQGRVRRPRRLLAKVSRPEVAAQFLAPAPPGMLADLVAAGQLTAREAELAARVPVAEDITVEADSGGHTDNRPLVALLPAIKALRDQMCSEHGYDRPVRVGAAGGLGTPDAVAAAFALGAAYVLTGSVNQACTESGLSADGRLMLSQAEMTDVVMAPSADMFEFGARVQVLRRGTMFPFRAGQLYQVYTAYRSWAEVPEQARQRIERDLLRGSFGDTWAVTRQYWQARAPEEVERAERDPWHQMALVFRWYLGMSSRWAADGDQSRRADYQIWCGPAMGAFNAWTAGTFLAAPENRTVVQVARNLLEGAAVITRAQQLRSYGVGVPPQAFAFRPRPLD